MCTMLNVAYIVFLQLQAGCDGEDEDGERCRYRRLPD